MSADGNDTPVKLGAPSDYNPGFCQRAMELCERGATDEELAQEFDVSARTIYRWKNAHPEFCQAIRAGKEAADERVERSLYQMATGTYVKQQQAIKVKTGQHTEEVQIVEVETYMAPEVPAAQFWLKNRRPDQWREKSDVNVNLTTQEQALALLR
jgi:transposase-like protein